MYLLRDHPDIESALRTGYPYWMQEGDSQEEFDEDAAYEERRDDHGWE